MHKAKDDVNAHGWRGLVYCHCKLIALGGGLLGEVLKLKLFVRSVECVVSMSRPERKRGVEGRRKLVISNAKLWGAYVENVIIDEER